MHSIVKSYHFLVHRWSGGFLSKPLPAFFLKYGIFLILLLAAVLRLLGWYWEPELSRDGVYYVELAGKWHETGNFDALLSKGFYIPPVLLFLMKKALDWGGDPVMAAVWINLLASVLCVWIVYELARIFKFSQEMALSAATLMAVLPSLVKLSYAVQRESLYLFFIGLGVLAIAKVEQRQKYLAAGWIVAGFCWSLALFTRHETLELGVMMTLILCWLAASKRLSWRSAGKRFCLFWLSAVVGMLIIHWGMGIPRQYYRTTLETRLYQSGFEN